MQKVQTIAAIYKEITANYKKPFTKFPLTTFETHLLAIETQRNQILQIGLKTAKDITEIIF